MTNFDDMKAALEAASGGRCTAILDEEFGIHDVMVRFPQLYSADVIDGADPNDLLPAFKIDNNRKIPSILISKFQNIAVNNRAYSLPFKTPATNINFDKAVEVCRNKGVGWHLMSNAEWSSVALWSKINNTQPYGNNNYGCDKDRPWIRGETATYGTDGKINLIKTGSMGALSSHDHTDFGVMDLNGNVWEWVSGVRLVYGELQVLIDVISTEWKALNAKATSYADLFVAPNSSDTVKLDYVLSHWQWQDTDILSSANSIRNSTFDATTYSGLSNFCCRYIQALGLGPDDSASVEDYGGDYFWANNGEAERCAFRGGDWVSGAGAGVFVLYFGSPRLSSAGNGGLRSCYYDPNSLISIT